ncbi:TPA: hypothetical protein GRI96_23830 [Vibrio parahaemolyticus]|uniref:hypothetical protein n=1 Tax=Vibrio parahaemolyticus TaxID=670 RepID=UPI000B056369|nr:hypothetical protein [Vibrio parahaemolyticus]EII3443344.1 hypothetical protein [Vibrio parahaemolyticus]ELA7843174.1 hypothetical protein [Vibrio parahaemolyticus]HAS6808665.1 hypothetical protein [Vibrio parahaemolyticus]HAS6824061.1 hypothetical protein [Vibrio parahaemolyticus]
MEKLKKFTLKGSKYVCIKCKTEMSEESVSSEVSSAREQDLTTSIVLQPKDGFACLKYIRCDNCGAIECIEYVKPSPAYTPENESKNKKSRRSTFRP